MIERTKKIFYEYGTGCRIEHFGKNKPIAHGDGKQDVSNGKIFVTLAQRLPEDFEIIVYVSQDMVLSFANDDMNKNDNGSNFFHQNLLSKQKVEINRLNNELPVCMIPWPLYTLGALGSFHVICQFVKKAKKVQQNQAAGLQPVSMVNPKYYFDNTVK